eukprot:PhF_6_TR9989/c0_g1_i2/m.15177
MAQLSRATHFRRDLNAAEDEALLFNSQYPTGVKLVGEFPAYVRCFEVIPGEGEPSLFTTKIWTGEQDGSIVQRLASTGEIIKNDEGREIRILRKPQTFVYAMVHVGNRLWCGLSDGYLRVFNTKTCELVFEKRRHVGAINVMLAAANSVFTGGDDFQILQWDTASFNVANQFHGSTNNVKVLSYDGKYLFSSGDDNILRSWDLNTGLERNDPWPLLAHKEGVRAMAATTGILFTGGKDGCVRKWDTERGALLDSISLGNCAVTSVYVLEISQRLMVATSSGVVGVLSMDVLAIEGSLMEHRNTLVNHVLPISRLDAIKLYVGGEDGNIRVVYTESDVVDPSYVAFPEKHNDMQSKIQEMREVILNNYGEMEQRKANLARLRGLDDQRKEQVRRALMTQTSRLFKGEYFNKLLTYLRIRRSARRRQQLGDLLLSSTKTGLMGIYYSKLVRWVDSRKKNKQRMELAAGLLKATNKGLQSLYLRNLIEYCNRVERLKKKRDTALGMYKLTEKGMLFAFFAKWRRWQVRIHNQRKRDAIAAALMKNTEKGMLCLYYKKVMDAYNSFQKLKKRETAAEVMAGTSARLFALTYYRRLLNLSQVNKDRRKKSRIGETLLLCTENGLRRLYFGKLLANRNFKRANKADDENSKLLEQIKEKRKLVEDSSVLTDEELDKRIQQEKDDMDRLNNEISDLDKRIADLEATERDLQRQLSKSVRINPSMTLKDQTELIMRTLKARGVMCGMHLKHVAEIRDLEKTAHKKPAQVVQTGIGRVRNVLKEASGINLEAGKEWYIESGTVNSLNDRQMKTALTGIREMCVGWDCLTQRGQNADEVTSMEEIIANSGWLLEIVMRDWNSRQPPAEASRPVKKIKIVVPQVAVAKSNIPVVVRLLDEEGKKTTATGKVDVSITQLSMFKVFPVFGGEARESFLIADTGSYKVEAEYEGNKTEASITVTELGGLKIAAPTKVASGSSGEVLLHTLDESDKAVPCSGSVEVTVNGKEVADIKFENGDAKVPVQYDSVGTVTITAKFGGKTANASINVVDMPKPSALGINAPNTTVVNQPFDVEVSLLDDAGSVMTNAEGTVTAKAQSTKTPLTAKPASAVGGVAKLSVTLSTTGPQAFDVVCQGVKKTVDIDVTKGKPSSPRANAAANSTAAASKPWTGFEIAETLLVKSVYGTGPAFNGGLTVGDKVLKLNGTTINTMDEFRDAMKTNAAIGKKLKVSVQRGGKPMEITITVGDLKDKGKS